MTFRQGHGIPQASAILDFWRLAPLYQLANDDEINHLIKTGGRDVDSSGDPKHRRRFPIFMKILQHYNDDDKLRRR